MLFLLAVFLGLLYTDVVGYFVHKLLHSGRIDFLYRLHMEHHITQYPPHDLRSETYRTTPQPKILGAGPEWALPIGTVMAITFGLLIALGTPWWIIFGFFGASLSYALVAYSWLHDQFHLHETVLGKFWEWAQSNAPVWLWNLADKIFERFCHARILHDVHHGNMKKNYGIGSYWLDKVFGTYERGN